jgi:hypothetical protein
LGVVDDDPTPPRPLVVAAAIVGLEGLALVGLALFLLVDTATGGAAHVPRGLLSAAFALLGAAALGFGARGLLRMSTSARTPVVVLELLALPVAYSLVFDSDRAPIGWPIFVAALAVLYLLFTPPVRAVMDRDLTR